MKQMLLSISALIVTAGLAYAQAEAPVIDQRQANQEKRIDQGIVSGHLHARETNRLNKQQEHINKMEDRAKADGVVTDKEKARLEPIGRVHRARCAGLPGDPLGYLGCRAIPTVCKARRVRQIVRLN